jgi:hypothetical protein
MITKADRQRAYNRKCYAQHREGRLAHTKKYHTRVKLEVFQYYSGGTPVCKCCGESNMAFLSIDHINGRGTQHRKEIRIQSGIRFYFWLRRNNFPLGYQVLCHNCNQGKWAYGECPHKILLTN